MEHYELWRNIRNKLVDKLSQYDGLVVLGDEEYEEYQKGMHWDALFWVAAFLKADDEEIRSLLLDAALTVDTRAIHIAMRTVVCRGESTSLPLARRIVKAFLDCPQKYQPKLGTAVLYPEWYRDEMYALAGLVHRYADELLPIVKDAMVCDAPAIAAAGLEVFAVYRLSNHLKTRMTPDFEEAYEEEGVIRTGYRDPSPPDWSGEMLEDHRPEVVRCGAVFWHYLGLPFVADKLAALLNTVETPVEKEFYTSLLLRHIESGFVITPAVVQAIKTVVEDPVWDGPEMFHAVECCKRPELSECLPLLEQIVGDEERPSVLRAKALRTLMLSDSISREGLQRLISQCKESRFPRVREAAMETEIRGESQ